jgi:hypothetical protein
MLEGSNFVLRFFSLDMMLLAAESESSSAIG